jgi:predicted secreted Zn-dependent protease
MREAVKLDSVMGIFQDFEYFSILPKTIAEMDAEHPSADWKTGEV